MFVMIENKEQDLCEIDGVINRTRRGEDITPEFAMDILSKTNHIAHIKKLVRAIKDKCKTKEDILPYKEFIVSCVDERKMCEQAMSDLEEMAKLCGCEKDFNEANEKPKFYDEFDFGGKTIFVQSSEDIEKLEGENLKVYFEASTADLVGFDLVKIANIKFKVDKEVFFTSCGVLPEYIDVSKCDGVKFWNSNLSGVKNIVFEDCVAVSIINVENIPSNLDVSMCDKVTFAECDLKNIKELKFKEGARVTFTRVTGIPSDLDVSMCDELVFIDCDLKNVKELKFKEGARVTFTNVDNIPSDLDVSMCDEVKLSRCDLTKINELKFKDGAKVDLRKSGVLPKGLDVSMCSEVNLSQCDLVNVKEIKFRKGSKVYFIEVENCPEVIDLSVCDDACLRWREGGGDELKGVKLLKFKNFRQKFKLLGIPSTYKGEVEYTDDAITELGKGLTGGM